MNKNDNLDDANALNKDFYKELLYIIGLVERKENGILKLKRNKNQQSLISLSCKALEKYQISDSKRYDVALELSLLWINRILFLKLVESYMLSINNNDDNLFFTEDKLSSFNRFNILFFNILGRQQQDRHEQDKNIFPHVPFLNPSLFQLSDLEKQYFTIACLVDNQSTTLYGKTILKQDQKNKNNLTTADYIIKFINSFDYLTLKNSDSSTHKKQLINPAILGKIFEKINGYKDGAVFTPAFITEYMAKISIEQVIVNKFKKLYENESINNYEDLYNIIKQNDKKTANELINTIKICDPSVGSGHFLVACLNEILRVKSQLKILFYSCKSNKIIEDYSLHIKNDELIISDSNGKIFTYEQNNSASQALQEAIFNEKRIIIQNCLFGVDINIKSVEICKLRLWIELLKSTYYHEDGTFERLPNLDINIKVGDALISEYYVKVGQSLLTNQSTTKRNLIQDYKSLVKEYKSINATKLNTIKKAITHKLAELKTHIKSSIQDDRFSNSNHSLRYPNSLEWALEFPETWDDQGIFKGFDLIIGNPPYIQLQKNSSYLANLYDKRNFATHEKSSDIYALFYEQGFNLLTNNGGILCFVTSNKWLRANYGKSLRKFITSQTKPHLIIDLGSNAFDNVAVDTNILMYSKSKPNQESQIQELQIQESQIQELQIQAQDLSNLTKQEKKDQLTTGYGIFSMKLHEDDKPWIILPPEILSLRTKIEQYAKPLKKWNITIRFGIKTGYNEAFIIDRNTKNYILSKCLDHEETARTQAIIKPILRGKDIKRYTYEWADSWLINAHNGTKTTKRIELNNGKYQALYNYLLTHKEKLIKRSDQGTHWTNLRNCSYLHELSEEKIICAEIVKNPCFVLNSNYVPEATSFFMIGQDLKYITVFLNSSITAKLFILFYAGGGLGSKIYRYKKDFLENLPIPVLDPTIEEQKTIYDQLVYYGEIMVDLHKNKQENRSRILSLDSKINQIIYTLYNFTNQEINLLETRNIIHND